mmetsp:Transcript_47197/g.53340  ORF Transcript_47197/g.53340 Transcript_47197/m.53340 type:complete len:151 (+) Transcript_47197:244-696(+)
MRMIMVKMFQDRFDAVKVASMLSASRDLPYQHRTSFSRIQILSDIVRVKADQLLYIIFEELSTSYSKFAASLRTKATSQSTILDKALEDTAKYVDTMGALMDPMRKETLPGLLHGKDIMKARKESLSGKYIRKVIRKESLTRKDMRIALK